MLPTALTHGTPETCSISLVFGDKPEDNLKWAACVLTGLQSCILKRLSTFSWYFIYGKYLYTQNLLSCTQISSQTQLIFQIVDLKHVIESNQHVINIQVHKWTIRELSKIYTTIIVTHKVTMSKHKSIKPFIPLFRWLLQAIQWLFQ